MTWKHALVGGVTLIGIHYISGVFETRIDSAIQERKRLEQEVAIMETYAQSSRIQTDAGRIFQALPSEFNKIRVRNLFKRWENISGVSFTSIQSKENVSTGIPTLEVAKENKFTGSKDSESMFQPSVSTREYTLTAEGTFKEHLRLFAQLQDANRLVSLRQFSFQASEREDENIKNELIIRIYYQDSL